MNKMLKIAATVAALGLSAGAQASLAIDLFDTAQGVLIDTDATPGGQSGTYFSQVFTGGTDIIGNYRDLMINQTMTDSTDPVNSVSSVVVSGGLLRIQNQPGAASTVTVRWDGSNALPNPINSTSGLGSMDLSAYSFFQLLIVSADQGFDFTIEAYTSPTKWSKITLPSTSHPQNFPGTISNIDFAAFADCGFNAFGITVTCGTGGAVNFGDVNALQAIIDPAGTAVDIDLRLNSVNAIPEPASLALVGAGLFGAMGALRRRKAAK